MIRRILILTLAPTLLLAQANFDTVTVKATALRGSVYVVMGAGGNMGLSVGSDAAFLVDDQFAPLTPKILAAVREVTPQPIRFVVNTHWHGDHSGGNENLGKAGALLVAHDNVRKRMSTDQFMALFKSTVKASPPGALPVVTFNDSVTFHLNDDDLVAFHVAPAHTDGDVIVHFTKADVIHMGDTFMTISYPFVDIGSGGTIDGFVGAADRALAMCTPQTIVIPGHGPVTNCAELKKWRDMNAAIRDRVRAEMRRKRTLDQIKAAGLTREFDERWGKGFIKPEAMVEQVYRSLGGK
jgi:glyoxylase-like metal-dependent hydrolase (beta-lactamase superfamily II)